MNIAVILAGGIGSRMGADIPKQYVSIQGKPVLMYTLERFQNCSQVDKIIAVVHETWNESVWQWAQQYGIHKLACLAPQGDTRQESVLSGLEACVQYSDSPEDLVLIHDAARPLVTPGLIGRCIEAARGHDGCLPVVPVKDTIYYSRDGSTVTDLTDRSTLFCGQSPETLKLQRYLELNRKTPRQMLKKINGACELAFRSGFDISMIPGEETNFKLTTLEDMNRLQAILKEI